MTCRYCNDIGYELKVGDMKSVRFAKTYPDKIKKHEKNAYLFIVRWYSRDAKKKREEAMV